MMYDVLRWADALLALASCLLLSASIVRRMDVIPPRTQRVGLGYCVLLTILSYITVDAVLSDAAGSHRTYFLTAGLVVSLVTITYRYRDNL
jgi:hypothetical protein